MGGAEDLGELVYAVTRAVQPDAVIETGVATGVTSAYALAALADNQKGVLHSIDLPPSEMLDAGTVGAAIPSNLRSRWEYHWGSAKRLLPQVLTSTVGRRIFIHDSDHSYDHMMWELRTAWSVLSDGDAVICDDTHYHSAFVDFARSVGKEPTTFMQTQKNGTGGLLLR
jgi:cephalosporin hydroxylase